MVYSTETDRVVDEYVSSLISHQMLMNAVGGEDAAQPIQKYCIDFAEFKLVCNNNNNNNNKIKCQILERIIVVKLDVMNTP
jgi:hypothetical protein